MIMFTLYNLILQNKIWVKESAEQNFMYGNHVYKSGLYRITENTPKYAGVVVYSSKDIPMVRNKILCSTLFFCSTCTVMGDFEVPCNVKLHYIDYIPITYSTHYRYFSAPSLYLQHKQYLSGRVFNLVAVRGFSDYGWKVTRIKYCLSFYSSRKLF